LDEQASRKDGVEEVADAATQGSGSNGNEGNDAGQKYSVLCRDTAFIVRFVIVLQKITDSHIQASHDVPPMMNGRPCDVPPSSSHESRFCYAIERNVRYVGPSKYI
jgi:hypothetical protein